MNKKTYKVILILLLVLFIGFICVIGYFLYGDFQEYSEIDKTNNQVIDTVVNPKDNSIDWDKLLSINKDIVAWINVPDTNINYPVIQGKSNESYIHTNIYGGYSKGGSIFCDSYIQKPFDDLNTIIYGHNLLNGTMFSDLKRFSSLDYFHSHQFIYILLPNGSQYKYKVVSFHTVKSTDKFVYNPYVYDLSEYKQYVFQNNVLDTHISDFDECEPVLTLSTCTNTNQNTRFVLHASKVN